MTEKETSAEAILGRYVMWSMGAGLIPIPMLDLAAVTGIQLRMLSKEAAVFEVPFSASRAKSLVAALLGSVVPSTLGQGAFGSIIRAVPFVGQLAGFVTMPAFYGASTYAVGKVFIQHFQSGGTLLDFEPEKSKAFFKEKLEEGKKVVGKEPAKGAAPAPA